MPRSMQAESAGPDTHAAAMVYAARGWSVIPMQQRGKRPLVAWLEFQRRLAGPDEIDAWYRRWPDANVGIVTGRVSGLVVVDIDVGHGGAESLVRLENEREPLLPTVEALTGGGGRHFYFSHPGGLVPNRAGIAPGIDVRGDGGCVVAPPSVHSSGRRYAWAAGSSARRGGAGGDAGMGAGHRTSRQAIRSNTGARWCARVSTKASATRRWHRSPDTCYGTAWIHRWRWSCCWPGTACVAARRYRTKK